MSNIIIFPPVETASEEGLLAIGADTRPEILKEAYKNGIFPWPISEDASLTWFAPDPRGVIFTNKFHIPKSMKKFLKKNPFTVTYNKHFDEVIENCALAVRKDEPGTWIREDIFTGYKKLFSEGNAYSIDILRDGKLVAGLYGVCIGEIISGESMFHTESNASKLALISIMNILKKANIPFLDTQMITPIIESFGGCEISRELYMKKLALLDQRKKRSDIFTLV